MTLKAAFIFVSELADPEKHRSQVNTGDVEVTVRQEFQSFRAAFEMNGLLDVAWADGEAEGYANCERIVLNSLKSD